MSRQVRNQFNISSSVIGQVAIGNKGPTVFKQETKHFEAGSRELDVNISGGHFHQANIGGKATYNNKNSVIGGYGGGNSAAGTGKPGMTVQEIMYRGSGEAERSILNILRTGIDADKLKAILQNRIPIKKIEQALSNCPKGCLDAMVQSMLRSDAEADTDSDSDMSSSDSD